MNVNVAQRNQEPGNQDKNVHAPKHFQWSFPHQVPSFQFGQIADLLQCTLAVLHAQPPHWETELLETATAAAFKRSKSLAVAQVQEFKWAGSKTAGSIQSISDIYIYIYVLYIFILIYTITLAIGDHHPKYVWKRKKCLNHQLENILKPGCWWLMMASSRWLLAIENHPWVQIHINVDWYLIETLSHGALLSEKGVASPTKNKGASWSDILGK